MKLFTSYKKSRGPCFSTQNLEFSHIVILVFIASLFFSALHRGASAETVHIPDPNLRAALEFALDKEAGADITQADMASLEVLQASECRYLKRAGVPQWVSRSQRCPDDRFEPDIHDLTGLEFAVNLKELHLGENQISDVSPLKGLTNLRVLDLHRNFEIHDASPLSTLTNLTHLSLWANRVSDVSPLSTLTNLTYLSLENNKISDVSPLKVLTNLRGLDLETNRISDLSPLKDMTKLIFLDFDRNKVSDLSPLKDIIKLTQLDASDNQISDLSPLKNMTELTQLDLDDNQISGVAPLKAMIKLLWLDLDGNQIVDISPLQNMTMLTRLNLDDNQISNISALQDMVKLTKLDLDHNKISDVFPLRNMTKLTWLDLDDNPISDVSPLKNMTKLIVLDLGDIQISNISPLKDMIGLTELDLNDNQISDVSALKNMTKLIVLDLDGNQISDLSALSALTSLTELDLHDNQISDVSPLKNMTNLTVLDLRDNQISDFFPLAELIGNLIEYDNSNQTVPPINTADVNRDGVVNVLDLALVASYYGDSNFADAASANNYPDVNSDGVIDVRDLVAIAAEINPDAAAPTLRKRTTETAMLTAEKLTQWIQLAKQLDTQNSYTRKGITVLEQLLAALTFTEVLPQETALLRNYPNPFNPETWIPYQLARPAEVKVSIHSVDGKLVRTLALGHLPAGVYYRKSRAVYWDGRNELGESVASGVYFYTLTAGDFTATGKMLIRK